MGVAEAVAARAERLRRWWLRRLPDRAVEVVRGVAREAKDDRLGGLAAEVAFFALLSIFPAFLAVAAALGSLQSVVGGDLAMKAQQRVEEFLQTFLTSRAQGTVDAVRDLFRKQSGEVFTFGVGVALWSATRGMRAVLRAVAEIHDLHEERSRLRRSVVALALVLCTLVVTAVMLAMVVLGPLLGKGRGLARSWGVDDLYVTLWEWLRLPVAFLVLVGWATLVLHAAPHVHRGWRHDAAGALVTGVLSLLVSLAFRLYLAVFGGNPVFGVLGGALIVLMWLYLLSAALLCGAELNAVLAQRAQAGSGDAPSPPPAGHVAAGLGTLAQPVEGVWFVL
ncbi:MAG: YihY/virulence factor BrkB family protein [Actinomycetota bacterium]|nr:YihY/virulence factor BrkB family protein [Actinomycetota bacterium]